MSYHRGDNYIWSDGERLHIWAADGYDGWDEALWAIDESDQRREDRVNASGVSIPEAIMDEFVMMRLAQMVAEGLVDEVIDRAIARSSGNFGCDALVKKGEQLKAVLRQI
jgi:hypothetical protein